MGYLSGAGLIIVQAISGLILGLFVLRVLLPLAGARFRNPICQMIYQATNPLLVPLTRIVPNWRAISMAGVMVAWLLATLIAAMILWLVGTTMDLLHVLFYATATLIHFVLSLYFWTILIGALMSMFAPDRSHPLVELIAALSNPILRPFRRLPPHFPGIDLSPLWVLLLIRLIQYSLSYIGFTGLLS
ncbi:MAG: YggT family protein [Pseudomonadota bacterium]|nr:YggT family protein [Pseudomonadota bacterium]